MVHLMLLTMTIGAASPERTFKLADGVEMAYLDEGQGEPALVLVHCGNCRKEVWTETIAAFRGKHRVVAMDMPGHGRSGAQRQKWSMPLLGADVAALVDHLKLGQVILVGNSMGGPVSLEAARRLGKDRVLGVVAVDTLQNVEAKWPDESGRQLRDAYVADFQKGCNGLMLGLLLPKDAPAAVRERVDAETCGNDPKAAIALLESFREYDQAAAMRDAGVPIWAINATLVPTALEANRKYAPSYDLVLMEGVGHYPQMERPAEFQQNLRRAVRALVGKRADDSYVLGPDSLPQPDVPKGRVEGPFVLRSKVFSDTVRQYWIYVPAAYDASRPHALMVFQDGHAYLNPEGSYRVPVVFDNLIGRGDMPATIGIFVNPGNQGDELPQDPWKSTNRSIEYDSLGERYATFLLDEILPEVAARYNLTEGPGRPGDRGRDLRRHLLLHRGLGAARRLPQGPEPDRAASRTSGAATSTRP